MHWMRELLRCPQHPNSDSLTESDSGRALVCPICERSYAVIDGIPDLVLDDPSPDNFFRSEASQWDAQARIYDSNRVADGAYSAGIAGAVEGLCAKSGDLILDAACGTGLTVRSYYRSDLRVVAMDLSMESLVMLRAKVDISRVLLVRGNLLALPFRSGAFFKVMCANALQHLPDHESRRRSVAELGRVARAGGRVVISAHNYSVPKRRDGSPKEGSAGSYSGPVQYIYRFETREFRELIDSSMQCERVVGAGFPLPYRLKLSPLSRIVEKFLRKSERFVNWGNLLVAIARTES